MDPFWKGIIEGLANIWFRITIERTPQVFGGLPLFLSIQWYQNFQIKGAISNQFVASVASLSPLGMTFQSEAVMSLTDRHLWWKF